MAFQAKDGSKHTNHETMKQADSRQMAKAPQQTMQAEPDGDEMGGGPEDGAAVAQQHGPANMVEVTHMGNQHHVMSQHPDGHVHESDHGDAAMAHAHAGKLAGCGGM